MFFCLLPQMFKSSFNPHSFMFRMTRLGLCASYSVSNMISHVGDNAIACNLCKRRYASCFQPASAWSQYKRMYMPVLALHSGPDSFQDVSAHLLCTPWHCTVTSCLTGFHSIANAPGRRGLRSADMARLPIPRARWCVTFRAQEFLVTDEGSEAACHWTLLTPESQHLPLAP